MWITIRKRPLNLLDFIKAKITKKEKKIEKYQLLFMDLLVIVVMFFSPGCTIDHAEEVKL